MRRFAFPAATFALVLAAATPALAGTEEFSTFSTAQQEADDESAIDHFLTRTPLAWRDEWEHAPLALRTSQGCLTSGHWFIDTDLKLRSSLGQHAWFEVNLKQSESDIARYDYLDLTWKFPTPAGTFGAMFRPMPDKAKQDFALSWAVGADTSAFKLEATFGFEDVFNNFWAFRQAQVGSLSQPYDKRPYEPALRLATRHARWRAEASGKWLSSSRQRIVDLNLGQATVEHELWGVEGSGAIEADVAGVTIEARGGNRQARDRDLPIATFAVPALGFRRQWSAEMAVRRAFPILQGATLEARYLYQGRTELSGPPTAQNVVGADDRILNLDATVRVAPRFIARFGGLFDRVGVGVVHPMVFTFGTRNESRAYIGLIARFGRVSVQGIEGIELDPEPYPVWFVHDKGFLQLQTTF